MTRDDLVVVLQSLPENLPVVYATSPDYYEDKGAIDIQAWDIHILYRGPDGSLQKPGSATFYSLKDEGAERVIVIDPTQSL